ncbi:unnamed protein product [Dovyalis caffra]|uniref:Uncharacterized protein n=1 Tax=Dovyalis caffra TaxID=77055 RepID=A0AAV1R735_9ROSI|nr:unnamed protein product [Dovyalis caffra]CAK7328730.1 unnamed protein product [Dovyalis caffra]
MISGWKILYLPPAMPREYEFGLDPQPSVTKSLSFTLFSFRSVTGRRGARSRALELLIDRICSILFDSYLLPPGPFGRCLTELGKGLKTRE